MAMMMGEDFQYVLRILGTNVDGRQKVMYAMTSVKGIGRRLSCLICKKADVDLNKRAGELTNDEVDTLITIVQNPRSYKIPDWFLNRQKDNKDGKYSQVRRATVSLHLLPSRRAAPGWNTDGRHGRGQEGSRLSGHAPQPGSLRTVGRSAGARRQRSNQPSRRRSLPSAASGAGGGMLWLRGLRSGAVAFPQLCAVLRPDVRECALLTCRRRCVVPENRERSELQAP